MDDARRAEDVAKVADRLRRRAEAVAAGDVAAALEVMTPEEQAEAFRAIQQANAASRARLLGSAEMPRARERPAAPGTAKRRAKAKAARRARKRNRR